MTLHPSCIPGFVRVCDPVFRFRFRFVSDGGGVIGVIGGYWGYWGYWGALCCVFRCACTVFWAGLAGGAGIRCRVGLGWVVLGWVGHIHTHKTLAVDWIGLDWILRSAVCGLQNCICTFYILHSILHRPPSPFPFPFPPPIGTPTPAPFQHPHSRTRYSVAVAAVTVTTPHPALCTQHPAPPDGPSPSPQFQVLAQTSKLSQSVKSVSQSPAVWSSPLLY